MNKYIDRIPELTEEDRAAFERCGVIFATNSGWKEVGLALWAQALHYARSDEKTVPMAPQLQAPEHLKYAAPVITPSREDNFGKPDKTDFCSGSLPGGSVARAGLVVTPRAPENFALTEQPDVNCPLCKGEGALDSGGTTPWGEAIAVPCGCITIEEKQPTVELPILRRSSLCIRRDAQVVENASAEQLLEWVAQVGRELGLILKETALGYQVKAGSIRNQFEPSSQSVWFEWNPLAHDEDAYGLAVVLARKFPKKFSHIESVLGSYIKQCASSGDPYQGTREALVKCVARGDFC